MQGRRNTQDRKPPIPHFISTKSQKQQQASHSRKQSNSQQEKTSIVQNQFFINYYNGSATGQQVSLEHQVTEESSRFNVMIPNNSFNDMQA